MEQNAQNLRERVTKLKGELTKAEKELDAMVRNCQHQYGPAVYDPVYTPAYTIPGDPPGNRTLRMVQLGGRVSELDPAWRKPCPGILSWEATK